jgi:hypothetical protein
LFKLKIFFSIPTFWDYFWITMEGGRNNFSLYKYNLFFIMWSISF